jgi:hypothetical protein
VDAPSALEPSARSSSKSFQTTGGREDSAAYLFCFIATLSFSTAIVQTVPSYGFPETLF